MDLINNLEKILGETSLWTSLYEKLNNKEVELDFTNLDEVLKIYSSPNLWSIIHEKIYNEYKNDPEYNKCCIDNASYDYLINNNCNIYFKLTTYDNKSRKFQYKNGINVDTKKFNPEGCCSGGGLYFCKLEDLYQFKDFGNWLTPIIVPKNIPIYEEKCSDCVKYHNDGYKKFKAPCIYTLPRLKITNKKVLDFITNSSQNNNIFSKCLLYKSSVMYQIQEFLDFVGIDNKNIWSNETVMATVKKRILQKSDIALYSCFNNIDCGFDKFIINFLINTGMENLINNYKKKYVVNKNLNLDSANYIKWFTKEEIRLFKNYNIVVAGSNVLRYVTNGQYKPNDIDLYINKNDFDKLINSKEVSINNDKYKQVKKSCYNMKNIIDVVDITTSYNGFNKYGYPKMITKVYQVIVVNNDPKEFIHNNFDFDLCSISYDFASNSFINIVDKVDYSVLTIQPTYINKMCGTETDSYSTYRAKKTIQRMYKYILRGYKISNWEEFLIEVRDKMCSY